MGPLEREMLLAAFDSNWVAPVGPDLDAFEIELSDVVDDGVHAVGLSSGTAALHLALMAAGVKQNDDVFISDFTFAATVNAVMYCGANPVFIDSEVDSWNMDPNLLERALAERADAGKLPKAVLCVDLYGQTANYKRIVPICESFDVPLIEDAAEALGASLDGKSAGSFGLAAAFSFNGNKLITTSSGGMLVSHDKEVVRHARYLATQARQPVPHYEHIDVGYNYRLSNLLAAIGRAQLSNLRPKIARRTAIRNLYMEALGSFEGIDFSPIPTGSVTNNWLTCITVDAQKAGVSFEDIRLALESENIESRPLWKPMHQQPIFATCASYLSGVSADLFSQGLCLPSGSSMSDSDVERVVSVVTPLIKSR
jgi:pyridoxal phosphate-dependent aminotransferase EpsN